MTTTSFDIGETDDDTCPTCHGDGGYHDCGDDTCCCAADGDNDPDWVTCEDCSGSGLS